MSWKDLELAGYVFEGEPHVVAHDDGESNSPKTPVEYFIVARFTLTGKRGVAILARHPAHMLALRFLCHGYDWDYTRPYQLTPLRGADATVMVDFPPQHLAEQIFDDAHPPQVWPVPSRLSGRTRLIFDVLHVRNLKLTLSRDDDGLLDWSEFTPVVHRRAVSNIGLEASSQLEVAFGVGPYDKLHFNQARDDIIKQFAEPGSDVTALEVTDRLVVSPDEQARWVLGELSRKGPDSNARSYALWTATLDEAGRKSVRALWSRHFTNGQIPNVMPSTEDSSGPGQVPMSSVSPAAQWQVMGQTSIYGLPALRRLIPDADGGWNDAPNGSVIRPATPVAYLEESEPKGSDGQPSKVKNAGIAIAKPFGHAAIQLTSLGATVDAEWKGEPPSLYTRPADSQVGDAWCGFDLERLRIRQWLGRDVQIAEIYKGYLYPLGVRASYAVVRERRIKMVGNAPVSYIFQRRFIMTSGLPRHFPGPYHPHEAREFPVNSIRMKTSITPDLITPADSPGLDAAVGDEMAFWPSYQTGQGPRDVRFEWLTEDDVLVVSPLFFVRASLLSCAERMCSLEMHYNACANKRSLADLGGARQRYAAPLPPGQDMEAVDTALESYIWRLAVEANPDNPYRIDGRMEGADQPPFYPRLDSALVGLQSLDRLLNVSHGRYTVRFDTRYRDVGFDPKENFRGIFLRVDGSPTLKSERQGQNMGALVKQSVQIDAISRKVGLTKDNSQVVQKSGAKANDPQGFDPRSYFEDVMLFGAINLKDLVLETSFDQGTPKLIETVTQGARRLVTAQGMEVEKAAVLRINVFARRALVEFDKGGRMYCLLTDFMEREAYPGVPMHSLYPNLYKQLQALLGPEGLAKYLKELADATTVEGIAKAARVLELLEPLARELRALIKDPVPDLMDDLMANVQALQNWSQAQKDAWLNELKAVFGKAVSAWLQKAFCDVKPELSACVFGQLRTCTDLAQPLTVFDALPRAPLREVFSRRLQLSLDAVWITGGQLRSWLAQVPRRTEGLIDKGRLELAITLVEPYLKPVGSVPDDIRDPVQLEQVLRDLGKAVSNCIGYGWAEIDGLQDAVQHMKDLRVQFASDLADELQPIYDDLRALLPVLISGSEGAVHQMLIVAMQAHVEARIADDVYGILDQGIDTLEFVAKLEADKVKQWRVQCCHLLSAVLDSAENSQVGELLSRLCKVLKEVANGITQGLVIGLQDAVTALDRVAGEADSVSGPLGVDPASPSLHGLAFEARGLAVYLRNFANVVTSLDPCTDPTETLEQLAGYRALRDECVTALQRMAGHLQHLLPHHPADVDSWTKSFGDLTGRLLGLDGWDAFRQAQVQTLILALHRENEPTLARALEEVCGDLDNGIPTILSDLGNAALSPTALAEILVKVRQETLHELDARFAGHILRMIALSPALLDNLRGRASQFLAWLASQRSTAGAAPTITLAHEALICLFDKIISLYTNDPQLAALLAEITDKKKEDFQARLTLLQKERDNLLDLANAQTNIGVAQDLLKNAMAKQTALEQAVELLEGIKITDLAQHLTNAYASLLQETLEKLTEIIALFAPTKITTTYEWGVKLDSSPCFGMVNSTGTHDLALKTVIQCDLLTQTTDVAVTGLLEPFWIKLVDGFRMAKLTFTRLKFEMMSGKAPHVTTNISQFELLDRLKYLAALQSWLSGSKDGFYYKVMQDGKAGIEAGYSYDAGIIQIGNVQLINVSFHLGLKLYFDGTKAELFFKLADQDRPFLIACPPYGGGGWLSLTSDGQKVTGMGMSLVFGGAAALGFGILQFQARVVAGVMVEIPTNLVDPDGKYTVIAIFEAVGEGSIAGFGVSVFMRLRLGQKAEGPLYGEATLGFGFRIGFVKISYSVHTDYTMDSAPTRSLSPTVASNTFQSKIEEKTTQWNKYVENFSMDLLKP